MNTPEVRVQQGGEDTPMTEVPPTQNGAADNTQPDASHDVAVAEEEPAEAAPPVKKNPSLKFLDFLTSPIVEITVGQGENEAVLTAHQSLLTESPFLSAAVEQFKESGTRRIQLPDESVDAFACFLQYQYTGDYSPLQSDSPTGQDTEIDQSGEHLLKHARVYTLADKLGVPTLKTLAHSKIHRIHSTARGEIAYARYVYANTAPDDVTIRKPVATFWSQRSHVLRHEAEDEFKTLCLDVPELTFDVLMLVLDQKEKRAHDKADAESGVKGSARKRLRSGL